MEIPLPFDKLSLPSKNNEDKIYVVLVATGSFNPPTLMHLRMFELARDALNSNGFCVIGGYMSPVNDAYKKKDLVAAEHRNEMCNLACKSSDFIMVDPWEAKQSSFQRSLTVLNRVKKLLTEGGLIRKAFPAFGSLSRLELYAKITAWFAFVEKDKTWKKIISGDEILNENRDNIKIVDELVPNQISSTRLRECISRGLSIKYLTIDEVIDYIGKQNLYLKLDDN